MKRKKNKKSHQQKDSRRGSVIVVVLALLGALTMLGFLFYTLSAQEQVNAEYFSDSAKVPDSTGLDPDILFDFALRQIIVGPADAEFNSALWGGRKSLLPTMFGLDMHPYNGPGINLLWDGSAPKVDMNFDDSADGGSFQDLLHVNDGSSAWGTAGNSVITNIKNKYPAPDVDYTAPDLNSLFLSYDGLGINSGGTPIRVVIPSYHRPQLLRRFGGGNWYTNPITRRSVMRPHREHLAITPTGKISNFKRFISGSVLPADDFPFGNWTQEGVWNSQANFANIVYDADPDNDGVKEAIWLDLDFPVQELASGKKFIPIFAITLKDADALININAHGNAYGNTNLSTTATEFGHNGTQVESISKSNHGVSSSEVNPIPALISTAMPATTTQHQHFFGRAPVNVLETANMEWWWMLSGRGNMSSSTAFSEVFLGRWGEIDLLKAGLSTPIATRNPEVFPKPGITFHGSNPLLADDNLNYREGSAYQDTGGTVFHPSVVLPAFEHPLDFYGSGGFIPDLTNGKQRTFKKYPFLKFASYYNLRTPLGANGTGWNLHHSGQLMNFTTDTFLVNEPSETLLEEGESATQTSDDIFPPSENAGFQLSNSDHTATSYSGRALSLAPHTFSNDSLANPNGYNTRLRFTATSWDINTHGQTFWNTTGIDKFRAWEFNADVDSDGFKEFPPTFAGTSAGSGIDPFRPVLRELLKVEQGDRTVRRPQRKLSINGLLERINTPEGPRLRFRPLTPHPLNLDGKPVNAGPPIQPLNQASTAREQEWWARRDRQLMARDIFVMLYTFGGKFDNKDYTLTNASSNLYSDNELKEMAQFAVNLVDQLDSDDTITQFVYDKNLANGWIANDDGYTNPPLATDIERGMVHGVEHHELSISEAMAIFTKKIEDMGVAVDHDATEYDDAEHRDFLYIELENASPHAVKFDKQAWQIVVTVSGGSLTTEERRLTLNSNAPFLNSNSTSPRFVIGTTGDVHKSDGGGDPPGGRTGGKLPSLLKADPVFDDDPMYTLALQQIAPVGSLSLDLIADASVGSYRINKAPTTGIYQDGTKVNSTVTTPSGTDLLVLGTDSQKDGIPVGGGGIKVKIKLRRRVNLNRSRPSYQGESATSEDEAKDNPWVTVDEMEVPLTTLILKKADDKDSAPSITEKFQGNAGTEKGLFSQERKEVLNNQKADYPTGAIKRNSLGNVNFNNPAAYNSGTGTGGYQIWHPHFNRNYASVVELFHLPLYGPDQLLEKLGSTSTSGFNQIQEQNTAGYRFLHPEIGNKNRWYRILELIEVPSRQHQHSHDGSPPFVIDAGQTGGNEPGVTRIAGKINLNTLRYHQVLAGLLDNDNVFNEFSNMDDKVDASRNWWIQFLLARDGRDPYTNGVLPGVSTSRPFRSSNFALRSNVTGKDTLQDTIYRQLPMDSGQPTPRALFEVGTLADHNNRAVDITMKHKLLGKVANNSTTRSNVFHAFIQVDYFEVTEKTYAGEKVYQIGKKLSTSPGYRGFFVIDRSTAYENIQPIHLPPTDTFSFRQSYNYHSLVKHRQLIK